MEVRRERHARAPHRPQQAQRLTDDAQRRRTGEDPELRARHVGGGNATRRGSSPDREKHPESGDAHDVVDDRCPHVGAKDLPGVEKLAQQVVQPVEEELRQAQEGEEDRQMTDVVGVSRRCDHDQNGCEHHRHEGHEEQDRSGQRQQAIDVGVAIAATLDGPHNLGDQDRVEDPRGEKIEDGVGQGVGGLEGGAHAAGGGSHRRDEHGVAHEAEDARHHGARGVFELMVSPCPWRSLIRRPWPCARSRRSVPAPSWPPCCVENG